MKRFHLLHQIIKTTGMQKLLLSFLLYLMITACILVWLEPGITNIKESLWYCFVSCTTIGFGDVVAMTLAGRMLTILLTLYGMLIFAFIPGVIVSYYIEFNKIKSKESVAAFLHQLEHLDELSKEELINLSEKIKKRRYRL